MRLPLLLAAGLLWTSFTQLAAAQAICPPAGIETDPPQATNPGPGVVNTFNWYYGNYMPASYGGRRYPLNSSATTQTSIEL